MAIFTAMASAEDILVPPETADPVPPLPPMEDSVSPGAGTDYAVNPMFYDKPLLARQYGVGVLSGVVAGAIGFYIGNAFEGAIFGDRSHKGYLSFTGIRYRHNRGPYWGGGSGILLGTAVGAFFTGEVDEEQGGILLTVAGGLLTTAAGFALADAAGVQEGRGLLPFVPLLVVPATGAVAGYEFSRWLNDRKRKRVLEGAALLHPPRLAAMPGPDGMVLRLDALHLTF